MPGHQVQFRGWRCRVERASYGHTDRIALTLSDVEDGEQGWLVLLEGCAEKLPVSRRQWPIVRELAAG